MSNELNPTTPSEIKITPGAPVSSVQQTGEKNIYANHVENINITIQNGNALSLAALNPEISKFGDIEIFAEDHALLEEFKNDYAKIMEYCIDTDFTSELVDINFSDSVSNLYNEKWRFKSGDFKNSDLRKLKNKILKTLNELIYYVSPEFLRYHEGSGMLIFKNQSWEEGCRLRDEFRPNSIRLRQEIANLYVKLYPDEFADEEL